MSDMRKYLNSMCEPGASWPHGAWIESHCDKVEFAKAVTAEFSREIDPAQVYHGYCKVIGSSTHFRARYMRGATPVTVAEWVR